MKFLGYKSALLFWLVSISVTSYAQDCSRPEDGDLFVDKDWHAENSFVGSPDGRYPENGGVAPFQTIQAMLDSIQPGQCGFVRASETPYSELNKKSGEAFGGNTFLRGGTSDSNRIIVSGYPGEWPVIDNEQRKSAEGHEVTGFLVAVGDYITIKNFEIRNTSASGIMMHHSNANRGIIVENCHIHHNYGRDNIAGVRLDWCDSCIVRNNVIHDTYQDVAGSNPINIEPHIMHSGVHGYRPSNSIVENNLIYNVRKGVYQKEPHPENRASNIVRYNIFHSIYEAAYVLGNMGAGMTPSYDAQFHHNLMYETVGGVEAAFYEADGTGSGLKVYNNTIVEGTFLLAFSNIINVEVHSNLIQGAGVNGPIISNRPGNSPRRNAFAEIDYNLYFDVGTFGVLDRGLASAVSFNTFSSWRGSALLSGVLTGMPATVELHGIVADPLFANSANLNFVPGDNSPATGAGKNGSTIGAYGNGFRIGPDSTMLAIVGTNPIRKLNLSVTPVD